MTTPVRGSVATQIQDALTMLCAPGQVVELRIPKIDGKKRTDSGYFTDLGKLAQIAARYDGRAGGIYFTLNPVEPALLSRAHNRIQEWAELTTSDDYIARRRWLPIDCDPKVNGKKRPAGISSTDEEHAAALKAADTIKDWLSTAGWPEPIVADSGNGAALLYAIDLPNDKTSAELVERCLKALAAQFDSKTIDIDPAVFNAARIWKLYGTLAGKGDSTEDRPHRRAQLLSVPGTIQRVPLALLQALARRLDKQETPERSNGTKLDAAAWLKHHQITIAHEKPGKDGSTIYTLDACPFNADHTAPDSCVIQYPSGALAFKCLHSSCKEYDWKALREKMEPGVYDRKNGVQPTQKTSKDTSSGEKHSVRVTRALEALGYTFALNLCNNTIEVSGHPLDDELKAQIRVDARDNYIKPLSAIEDIYTVIALNHAYHPIHDYLNSLTWDGKNHIAELAAALRGNDPPVIYASGSEVPLIHVYLWRWMIGAVAKALDGHQNMMLVLAGPQRIGKSLLARWLCSGIPAFFLESPINVSDKDSDVRLISHFIWEVSELDATTRRADVSALKAFITKKIVTVRKAYGHHDTRKPALASLIGTVNESTGFLSDDTGNRRFMVAAIDAIDWEYSSLDINQLWAEAVAAYRNGETWELRGPEAEMQAQQNKQHETETIIEDWMRMYFDLTEDADDRMTAGEIVECLRKQHDLRLNGSERAQTMELARVLGRLGVRKVRESSRLTTWRGYVGIRPK